MSEAGVHSVVAVQLSERDAAWVYSIETAARITHIPRRRIALYYKHGLVRPVADPEQGGWYFDDHALRTLRRIEALREAWGLNLPAIKLVLDLMAEVERLQEEIRFLRGR